MYEKFPVRPNLYLFNLDLELLDSIDYPGVITDILVEDGEETFLVTSSRAGVRVTITAVGDNIPPDLTGSQKYFIMSSSGAEIESGTFYFRVKTPTFIVKSTGEVDAKQGEYVQWSYDVSPKQAMEAMYPTLQIHGPAINESNVSIVNSGTDYITRGIIVGSPSISAPPTGLVIHDLKPYWSVCRVDLGFSMLERVDLKTHALSITQDRDNYYVITEPLNPSYGEGIGTVQYHYPPAPNGNNQYKTLSVVYYAPPPQFASPIQAYQAIAGGFLMFPDLIGPPIPVNGVDMPNINDNMALYQQWIGYDLKTTNGEYVLGEPEIRVTLPDYGLIATDFGVKPYTGVTVSTVSAGDSLLTTGGGFQRLSPRTSIHKLNKTTLKIEKSGEWDDDLFIKASNFESTIINAQAPTGGPTIRAIPRNKASNDYDLVVGWPNHPKRVVYRQQRPNMTEASNQRIVYSGLQHPTVQFIYYTGVTLPGPILETAVANVPVYCMFYIDGIPITAMTALSSIMDQIGTSLSYVASSTKFAGLLSTGLGAANVIGFDTAAATDYNDGYPAVAELTGDLSGYALGVVSVSYHILDTRYTNGSEYIGGLGYSTFNTGTKYPMIQRYGGPGTYKKATLGGSLVKSGFEQGFILSGKHKLSQQFRIRYSTTPGCTLSVTTRYELSQGIQINNRNVAYLNMTSQGLPRIENIRIRYKDKVSAPFSINWPIDATGVKYYNPFPTYFVFNQPTGQNYVLGASIKLATALTEVTGVTWTPDVMYNTGLGGYAIINATCPLASFAVTSSTSNLFEVDYGQQYTQPISVDASGTEVASILSGVGFTEAQAMMTGTVRDSPVLFKHYNALMSQVVIDKMDGPGGYPMMERAILDQEMVLKEVDGPYDYYPKMFKETLAVDQLTGGVNTSGMTFSEQVHVNSFGEYFTDGIRKFDANHNFISQTQWDAPAYNPTAIGGKLGFLKILYLDRFDDLIVRSTSNNKEIYVLDRNLVYKGKIPTDFYSNYGGNLGTGQGYGVAVDRHHNYYVLGAPPESNERVFNYTISKYNQRFEFVSIFGTQTTLTGVSLGSVNSPKPNRLKVIGDYILGY